MRRKVFALVIVLALGSVFVIDVCGLVFGCGCRSLWAGAAEACNIHNEGPPHCPWCEHPLAAGAVAFGAMAVVQAAVILGPGRAGLLLRSVLALLSFPLIASAVGTIQGFLWEYWGR
jgi:hypothetical protein